MFDTLVQESLRPVACWHFGRTVAEALVFPPVRLGARVAAAAKVPRRRTGVPAPVSGAPFSNAYFVLSRNF